MVRTKTITVAIIDDNRVLREALTVMLNRLPDVDVVLSDDEDFSFLAESQPHVVLLDVGLRDHDSLRMATSLREANPYAKIIVMDLFPVHEEIREFVNAGVAGFVLKDASFDDFVETIRTVAAGGKVLPAEMAETLFSQIAKAVSEPEVARTLSDVRMTPREHEVIDLIGEGLSNKEIASRLNIASHTVKSHVRNVMEKLAMHSRLQISAYSHRERSS
jgi:DNA-binding NarL/FixJ family response regulator